MRKKKEGILFIGIAGLVVLLNVIAWNSTAFCDAYIEYVFPIWVGSYGRLTGLFPFSVGEIMLGLGMLLVVAAAGFLPVMAAVALWQNKPWQRKLSGEKLWQKNLCGEKLHQKKPRQGKKRSSGRSGFWQFCRGFYRFFAWTVLIVSLVMTLNCFILYHASTFSHKYFGEDTQEHTLEELVTVRNYVVQQCNRLAMEMERDEQGRILYDGDMKAQAISAMQELGSIYPQLAGYYPNPKPLYTSDFFCQQYMCGYYFPFSMEANYNDVMYIMNKPATLCHELAHLKGYIFEDEANFISYLACIGSEDKLLQYSGYLSVLNYLDNDFYKAVSRDKDAYLAQPNITAQVIEDNVFVAQEEWDRINSKAWIDTETVDEVSDVLVDATLKANGVSDGMISYNRVVKLLLQYYSDKDNFI